MNKTTKQNYRIETDILGSKKIPADKYYGIETARAIENFPLSLIPLANFPYLITALAAIKEAAAKINKQQKTLTPKTANAIIKAAQEVQTGKFNDQFPVDMIQGGAGTSTHMNINEVIANRALELLGHNKGEYQFLHPLDHVNASQSTNDVHPTAGNIAIIWYCQDLLATLQQLRTAFSHKANEFRSVLKIGRTHLQNATPMTLGQEFTAFADSINDVTISIKQAIESLLRINLGGTAIGTGINSKPGYAKITVKALAKITNLPLTVDNNLIKATSNMHKFSQITNALKEAALTLNKIANDLQLLSSELQNEFTDITLPAVQIGSSSMPGKTNPVIPEAVNQICFQVIAASEAVDLAIISGQLQANVFRPSIIYNIMQSAVLLQRVSIVFREKCIVGITSNRKHLNQQTQEFAGLATALIPYIGYDKAAEIATKAQTSNKSVFELAQATKLIPIKELKKILNPKNMLEPNVEPENLID